MIQQTGFSMSRNVVENGDTYASCNVLGNSPLTYEKSRKLHHLQQDQTIPTKGLSMLAGVTRRVCKKAIFSTSMHLRKMNNKPPGAEIYLEVSSGCCKRTK